MTAVCLVGCDRDTASDGGGMPDAFIPISFSAHEGEEETVTRSDAAPGITRAEKGLEDVLPAGDEAFKVWGFKNTDINCSEFQTVMNGYNVKWTENSAATSTSNSHNWEYVGQGTNQTIKYWDWSATAYRFFGYVNVGATNVITTLNTSTFTFSFYANADNESAAPYYSRLWISDNNYEHYPTRKYGEVVQLEFLKPFAKVRFLFISDEPDVMPIEDVDITNVYFKPTNNGTIEQEGTMTITYPLTGTWGSGTGSKETYEVTGATGISAFEYYYYEAAVGETDEAVLAGQKYWYTVLPATGQGTYTLNVTVNGEDQDCVVPADFMNWLPCYQYTYVFKIHADNGVSIGGVYSAFKLWDDTGKTKDHTIYNW